MYVFQSAKLFLCYHDSYDEATFSIVYANNFTMWEDDSRNS